jgi:hypothetical protein
VRISSHLVAAITLAVSFGQQPSAPAQNDAPAELRIAREVATPLTQSENDLKSMRRQP